MLINSITSARKHKKYQKIPSLLCCCVAGCVAWKRMSSSLPAGCCTFYVGTLQQSGPRARSYPGTQPVAACHASLMSNAKLSHGKSTKDDALLSSSQLEGAAALSWQNGGQTGGWSITDSVYQAMQQLRRGCHAQLFCCCLILTVVACQVRTSQKRHCRLLHMLSATGTAHNVGPLHSLLPRSNHCLPRIYEWSLRHVPLMRSGRKWRRHT